MEDFAFGGNMCKLTTSNYPIWKARMEDMLFCKNLHYPIDGNKSKPSDMSNPEWELINRKTVALIRMWIDDSLFHHVALETNALSLWRNLASLFENPQSKPFVMRKLMNLRYRDGDNIAKHMNDFQDIVHQLHELHVVLPDELQAYWFVATLPDSWEFLVNSAPDNKLSISVIRERLFIEEAIKKEQGSSSQPVAGFRNSQNSNNCDESGRGSKSTKECFHCGERGHVKKDCEILEREQLGNGREERDEDHGLVSLIYAIPKGMEQELDALVKNSWIFSTVASNHISSNRHWFETYNACTRGYVTTTVGGKKLEVEGIGNVKVKTHNGSIISFGDVRHVPKFHGNLISVGRLTSLGHIVYASKGVMEVRSGATLIMKGGPVKLENVSLDLFVLRGSTCIPGTCGSTQNRARGKN